MRFTFRDVDNKSIVMSSNYVVTVGSIKYDMTWKEYATYIKVDYSTILGVDNFYDSSSMVVRHRIYKDLVKDLEDLSSICKVIFEDVDKFETTRVKDMVKLKLQIE